MIEIVYKDEKQPTEDKKVDTLPKNIRQIGEPEDRIRVYLEDFASTYLQKTGNYRPEQAKICILYGKEKEKSGQPVLFVQSAARVDVQDVQKEGGFHEPDWNVAEGIRKKFFPEQDVLGWAVIAGGQEPLLLEQAKTVHRHHFTGRNQILYWWDGGEKEEILSGMGTGELMNLNGYYIYYEENRSMREYMISHNPTDNDRVGEPEDRAVKDFRQVVESKKTSSPGAAGRLVRVAAAACVVFAIAGVLRYTQDGQNAGTLNRAADMVRQQWEGTKEKEETTPEAAKTAAQPEDSTQAAADAAGSGSSTQETASVPTTVNVLEDLSQETQETAAAGQTAETSGSQTAAAPGERTAAAGEQTAEVSDGQTAPTSAGPAEENSPQTDSAVQETGAEGYRAYQVKAGDTISSISQAYYGTMSKVQEICALNRIEQQDLIYTGQILLLP